MRSLLVWIAAVCAVFTAQAADSVSVELRDGRIAVRGWTAPPQAPAAGWESVLAVYGGVGDVPALAGEYSVTNGTLTFRPKYPLSPGLKVRAVFRGVESFFDIPRPELTASTRVAQVYPSAAELPENQLKFYIEFSARMSQGQAWRHIRLLKSNGQAVELPFLEIDQEMWDAETRRLTILFDPGRIKRGVKPLEDIGPAIEAGHTYSLVVDRDWQDAAGAPLVEPFRKEFRVVEADRAPISVANWVIGKIQPNTREPLIINFSEPLDSALALRLIWIDGFRGRATLSKEEREWRFVPDEPWTTGKVTLKVDRALEDLAGNKVGRAFDVDVFERVSKRVEANVLSIPIGAARR